MPSSLRSRLKHGRRAVCELLGVRRYSYLALNGLDRKLERYLDFDGGVFVEAGANDGLQQSNTYYFERWRGWRGLLIEPVPTIAAECRRNRGRSLVMEAALAESEVPGATVEIWSAGLMSTVPGALGSAELSAKHVTSGLALQGLGTTSSFQVPARTLSSLLDEAALGRQVDLLSLDVEGGEVPALRGLDISSHAPRYICVESRDDGAIAAVLGERYKLVEILTDLGPYRDLLFALR